MEHAAHGTSGAAIGAESVDTVARDGVTVTARAPGAWHPECGASSTPQRLIRPGNDERTGPGRRWHNPASVVVIGDEPRWHCIETAPRAEHMAAAEIEALGVTALVPQYLATRRVRERVDGVVRMVDRPALLLAFPRYVFAEFDAAERGWRKIATRHGVTRLMGADPERPLAVPAMQMAWVIAQFGEDGVQRRAALAAPIQVGAMVRMIAGPLEGHVAPVTRSNGRTVWVDWAGRPVSMAQAAVQVVGPPPG